AALALLSDVSMGTLGGALKRKEKLSARLGDILSCLYLASATLKRYEDDGRHAEDAPLMHSAIWGLMFEAQNAFEGVLSNFPSRFLAAALRLIVFPAGRPYVVPSDRVGHKVAQLLIEPSATRDRLTADMFIPADAGDPVRQHELALEATVAAEPIEERLRVAIKKGRFAPKLRPGEGAEAMAQQAMAAGLLSADEVELLARQRELAAKIVRVDDFEQDLGTSLLRSVPPVTQFAADKSAKGRPEGEVAPTRVGAERAAA
ncbi:MAG: DUF1974 domain-containing protein, partial [Betaproteobacteria bacterium]|nr:DUF1974 domain-containing protein [Betaproteobacteria bacterium]